MNIFIKKIINAVSLCVKLALLQDATKKESGQQCKCKQTTFPHCIPALWAHQSTLYMQLNISCPYLHSDLYTAKNQCRKFETNIPTKGIARSQVPISTFMCLWAIYIFLRSIWLFFCRKYVERSWEYINRSQTHECGNWDWLRPRNSQKRNT